MPITNYQSACQALAFRSNSRRAFFVLLTLALSLTALSLRTSATTIPYKSFDDLMKEADGVVAGHVVSVESQYNSQKEIYTFVTFDQLQVLSGSYQEATLTLRFKGGQIDNNITRVVGSPEFKVEDRAVLFVHGNGRYMVPLVGWTQGVFRIVQDSATQQDVIHDAVGNRVVGLQNGQVLSDRIVQPEATIVNLQGAAGTAQTDNQADSGSPDTPAPRSALASAASAAQVNALRSLPTMQSRSFLDTVKNSASLRQSKNQLTNVRLSDFSVASANVDAGSGAKVSGAAAAQGQAPVLPQQKQVPQVQN